MTWHPAVLLSSSFTAPQPQISNTDKHLSFYFFSFFMEIAAFWRWPSSLLLSSTTTYYFLSLSSLLFSIAAPALQLPFLHTSKGIIHSISMVQLQSQDQSESKMPNTSVPVGNSCTDSYGPSGHMLKVRKPYTISKQREKWTEDEHLKFLEALKLYGRGWRKIQEHVGTKTAVQIRSHAQKFFSKVVRESSGSMDNSIEPIEIPPPRPKRKPVHPYPRKPVDILEGTPVSNHFERSPSPKGIPASKQVERSPSPDLLVAEKESRSPTSVLSAVASKAVVSALSEQQNGCSSPSSCTTDMNSSLLPIKKENEHTSNSSSDGNKKSLSSVHVPSMSIKLFGTTVSVACCQKPPSPGVGPFMSSTLGLGGRLRSEEFIERSQDKKLGEELSLGLASPNSTLLASGSSAYRYLELQSDNGHLLETSTMLPLQVFCEGISYNQASARMVMDSSVQSEEMSLVERSCTGSHAGSAVEAESGGRVLDVDDSKSHQPSAVGRNSLQTCGIEGRDRLRKITRGFVPYKRCMAEKDMSSPVVVSEECERQRARVCS